MPRQTLPTSPGTKYETGAVARLGKPMATVEPRDKRVALDEVELHYAEWGDAANPPMVLLHGFMKKTQATPKREIEIARARQRTLRRMS